MNIEKMRSEFEVAFMQELEVDLSGNRHTDDEGLECYQFDGDDHDERSKLASIAFMFWQQSRSSLQRHRGSHRSRTGSPGNHPGDTGGEGMTDYLKLQARCQRGEGRIADANNLLAECYGALGVLMAEVKKIDADRKACWAEFKVQGRQLDELKTENELLRKDAERYEWLRSGASVILNKEAQFTAESGSKIYSTMPTQRELDSAIDAAMFAGGDS